MPRAKAARPHPPIPAEPKKNPASAVTTIRNGNRAISVDNAMWLAIAQPSSSMKCRNASAASRTDHLRARNGYSLQAAAIQIVYCCTLCKPGLGALRRCSAAKLCRLHVGEELTDLRASVVTPATRLIASAPTRASPEARLTSSAIDATALLKSRLELASAWDCVTVAKARPTSPSPETYVEEACDRDESQDNDACAHRERGDHPG